MKEQTWLKVDWDDLYQRIRFAAGKVSARKLRLLAASNCRLIWPLIPRRDCKKAVEVAEAFADGEATKKAMAEISKALRQASRERLAYWQQSAFNACFDAVRERIVECAFGNPIEVAGAALHRDLPEWDYDEMKEIQLSRLLDVVGPLPFRKTKLQPNWLTDTVTILARTMYDSRDFGAMPILADALQDAGCDNDEILLHCRDPKQHHCRGCWVVDLILGKE
jgi:hypothetical protein